MEKKIIVRMMGGLANRMFQFSCYLYLKKQGYNAFIDDSEYRMLWDIEDINWARIFPEAKYDKASKKDINKSGGGHSVLSKVIKYYFKFISKAKIYSCSEVPNEKDIYRYHHLQGVFQNAEMVDAVHSEVFKAFAFSEIEIENNIKLIKELDSTNSVGIHIRKGKDYLQREDTKGTCPLEYYLNAIAYIKHNVTNPQFYVFTDNIDWVNDNLKDLDYKLIDWNSPKGWGNHFDMQLMSHCKHNIIANSTYSWWGAYLNGNNDKIVVMPKRWFSNDLNDEVVNATKCKNWILF